MKALLIVNPRAGKNKKLSVITDYIKETFASHGTDVTLVYTTCKGDATEIAKREAGNYDFYLCCGGDGTLSETIAGIMQIDNDIAIGYIPTGSTNDMAKTLGLPKSFRDVTEACAVGVPTEHDVGVFDNESFFTYIASFGAFTEVSYSTSQKLKNNLGHFAYILGGAKQIPSLRCYKATVKCNGEEFTDDFLFGSVSNTLSFAGIFKYKKEDVSLNDGLFEVLLIRKPRNPVALTSTVHGMLHKKYNPDRIILLHSDHVEITFHGDAPDWSLDGECAKGKQTLVIDTKCKAINIIR